MSEFKITNTIFDKKLDVVEADVKETEDEEEKEQQITEKKAKIVRTNVREVSSFSISIDSTSDKSDHF